MKTTKFTYWQEARYYLSFLNAYPDYQTQGMTKEEFVGNLKDLLADLESGGVPHVWKACNASVSGAAIDVGAPLVGALRWAGTRPAPTAPETEALRKP